MRSVGRVVMQQIANLWPNFLVHRFESYTLRQKIHPTEQVGLIFLMRSLDENRKGSRAL